MKKSPLLYVNQPWMEHYQGASEKDIPKGNFAYTREHAMDDHCQFNFARRQGTFYGHVPGATNPNLTKLSGFRSGRCVRGVTVIWIATHPESNGRVIVGWYKNATVWQTRQRPQGALARQRTTPNGNRAEYTIEAPVAHLLLPGERPALNTRDGRPGQNPFWYGNPAADRQARGLIAGYGPKHKPNWKPRANSRAGWIQDPAERLRIEANAMKAVEDYYAADGYKVEDVSGKNCGYDFLVSSEAIILHVEVKGCKGGSVCVELTPNEYSFAKKNSKTFRLCVVLDALSNQKLRVFRSIARAARWRDEVGEELRRIERIAAVIRE